MAVGADQFTFRDLVQDGAPCEPTLDEVAHFSTLSGSGQVIPVHCSVVKDSTAIGARLAFLQLPTPYEQFAS
jgi:hypothetical protein